MESPVFHPQPVECHGHLFVTGVSLLVSAGALCQFTMIGMSLLLDWKPLQSKTCFVSLSSCLPRIILAFRGSLLSIHTGFLITLFCYCTPEGSVSKLRKAIVKSLCIEDYTALMLLTCSKHINSSLFTRCVRFRLRGEYQK